MRILFTCVFVFLQIASIAQSADELKIKNIGLPLMANYTLKDYSSKTSSYGSQNYDVLLGDDGRMYFANIEGLLIFDGAKWIRFRLPGNSAAYSLAKSKNSTVFIGGMNEFGYLATNTGGELVYHSLKESLTDYDDKAFLVNKIFTINDEIYFLTDADRVFIYNLITKQIDKVETLKANTLTGISNGIVYSYQTDGLHALKKNEWKKVRDTDLYLTKDLSTITLLDLPDDQTILLSSQGFFDFESEQKIAIHPDVALWLASSTINRAVFIGEKYIAICANNGMLITDLDGMPIQLLNQSKGLNDDIIHSADLDRSGLLWLGTNSGINSVEVFSPFTVFDKRLGITGNVSYMKKDQDDTYLATALGTQLVQWNQLSDAFRDIPFETINSNVSRWLLQANGDILSIAGDQVIILKDGKTKTFDVAENDPNKKYWTGFVFENSEDVLLGSMTGKILHLTKDSGIWKIKKELNPSISSVIFMAQGDSNTVWLTNRKEVWKMKYDAMKAEIVEEQSYGQEDGLPYAVDNYVFRIGNQATFSSYKGIHTYDPNSDRFVKDPRFEDNVGDMPLLRMSEDPDGNVYCLSDGYLILKKTMNGFEMNRILNEKMINYNPFNVIGIDNSNVLLPTFNAFVHVDPTISLNTDTFNARITEFKSIGLKDSLYFGGFGTQNEGYRFDYKGNAIRVDFSSDFYQNVDQNSYKWRLVGFDDEWSGWSSETSKDYTNLPHGSYAFEVVAKNIHYVESSPGIVSFTISTPWYFTIWAYGLYFLLFIGFVWGIVRFNTRRLRAQNLKLEELIEERTSQISDQRNKLLQMDELKKRFFVNISHELRTPLTLSMGTVDQALRGNYGKLNDELYSNLNVSKRNSERLLKMVNSILDISKLEGGRIQLYARAQDPVATIKKVLAFFSSRFEDKKIELQSDLIDGSELYLDDDRFETILINLLSNAFKFTPEGGKIEVTMIDQEDQMGIEIKDSGEGIPDKDLELVFDRFYQSPTVKSGEGMGVGLALTKELVELHKGNVQAKNNGGAEFVISFPKGADHLSPNEIIEEEKATSSLEDKYPLHDDTKAAISIDINHEATEHLLLVEDNSEMAQFISSILQNKYRVSHVKNGLEGLQFLKEEPRPDLIITDYLMPEMDGYEMAQEIKKDPELATLPMIFLTARAREQDKINVLNLGVDDYLFKPFNPEELLVRIKNLLYTQKQRTEFVQEEAINPEDIEWKDFESKLKLKVDEFISENIKNEITSDQLAEFTSQSERTLYRKIKANTGLSMMGYVKEYRLRKARTMLENQEMITVSEISYAVGFNYLSHFTKSFKERFGKQPSEYLD